MQSAIALLQEVEQARLAQQWAQLDALAARLPSSDVADHECTSPPQAPCTSPDSCPSSSSVSQLGLRALVLGEAALERCLLDAADEDHSLLVAQRYLTEALRKSTSIAQDKVVCSDLHSPQISLSLTPVSAHRKPTC